MNGSVEPPMMPSSAILSPSLQEFRTTPTGDEPAGSAVARYCFPVGSAGSVLELELVGISGWPQPKNNADVNSKDVLVKIISRGFIGLLSGSIVCR